MRVVTRSEFDELREAGLIRFGRNKNYRIMNKNKSGKRKKYVVVEEQRILDFLDRKAAE